MDYALIFLDFLKTYTAETIALCALIFTAWNTQIQRRHNVLSVKPHLTSFTHKGEEENLYYAKLQLMNNGLGPAFIKSFQCYLDKNPCDYDTALNYVTQEVDCKWYRTRLGEGYAVKPGEILDIFTVVFQYASIEQKEIIITQFNRVDISIEYECIYKKQGKFDTFHD